MKIFVHEGGKKWFLALIFPTRLLYSRFSRFIVTKAIENQKEVSIPPKAIEPLFSEIKRMKKKYGKLQLVEVSTNDGTRVSITL